MWPTPNPKAVRRSVVQPPVIVRYGQHQIQITLSLVPARPKQHMGLAMCARPRVQV